MHAARTSVAAVASLLLAGLVRLPESYWAAITTIVIESTLRATVMIPRQRLIGTALGAAIALMAASLSPPNALIFGVCIFVGSVVCALLHPERNAFRYTGITVTNLQTGYTEQAWLAAIHRFVEISLGIVAGLIFAVVWPEHETGAA